MKSALEERHPHIIRKLNLLWKSPYFDTYINNLILSDRIHRIGFTKEVIAELMTIQRVHNQLF